MEQSRSENRQRQRDRKRRKNKRLAVGTAAAAVVLAGGLWAWSALRNGPETESEVLLEATASPSPSVQASAASTTVSPSPTAKATAVPSPTPAAAVQTAAPSSGAGAGGSGLKMAFVGDVLFASTVETVLKQNGADYPYRDLADLLRSPDWTVANLETPVTERGDEQKKEYTYRSKPEMLKPFKDAGFDVVNLANNHIMDYGREGLLDTLRYLKETGIPGTGAGHNIDEAYAPVVLEHNGIKTAFLGFSHKVPENSWKATASNPGTTQLYDPKRALEAIAQAKKQADLVVVLTHWGEERKDKPLESDRTLAHKMIDAGADLIVGGHPHVLQGFEMYKGKWIAYSLGNFLFTTNTVPETWETVVLNAECSRKGDCSLSAVPVWNKFAHPVRMSETEGAALFKRLSGVSYGASIDAAGRIASAGTSAR